jgi:hypothetical protein
MPQESKEALPDEDDRKRERGQYDRHAVGKR